MGILGRIKGRRINNESVIDYPVGDVRRAIPWASKAVKANDGSFRDVVEIVCDSKNERIYFQVYRPIRYEDSDEYFYFDGDHIKILPNTGGVIEVHTEPFGMSVFVGGLEALMDINVKNTIDALYGGYAQIVYVTV